ncbi:rolling stone-like [Brachionus plicatilis]|uniref:Rolling stone-like n=1 Tax=Brachionus plicatilis TaxID=10195 RepID=A0A3M7QAW9_BRAPC|nr:rolling stone-like [Brachionus plicatilis]
MSKKHASASTKLKSVWQLFGEEFQRENLSLHFENHSQSISRHPEKPWPVYMTSWSLTILVAHLWTSALIVLYFYTLDKNTRMKRIFQSTLGSITCSHRIEKCGTKSEKIEIRKKELKMVKTYCDQQDNCYLPSSSVESNSEAWKLWIEAHIPNPIIILLKISWLLYNLIVISTIVVTFTYFSFVFIMDLEAEPTWFAEIGNMHRHGFNSLVAIIDVILLAYPVRIMHFVYTSLYGWCYALVIFIYWIQDPKTNIVYEQIDYNKPYQILGIYILLTLLTLVMQILHFFAYQFKLYLKIKYFLKNE